MENDKEYNVFPKLTKTNIKRIHEVAMQRYLKTDKSKTLTQLY